MIDAIRYAPAGPEHTLTGEFRMYYDFRSRFLQHDRHVLVYLPPGYSDDDKKRYPVLYLNDGQNMFDGATSFVRGQEWGLDETADQLIRASEIEPLIMVAIYNTGDARIDEYTPTVDPKLKKGGRADLYGQLILEELKPLIDASYRTQVGPAHTGLGGSSLGGLVSLYLALKYPNVFGKSSGDVAFGMVGRVHDHPESTVAPSQTFDAYLARHWSEGGPPACGQRAKSA
jgi:predicted alpha/beta superfamily hydrolase